MGAKKTFTTCSVFQRFWDLMANICWTKRDTDNRVRVLDSTKGLLRCPKVLWTLVHKWLKPRPEFLPTLTISFCPSPSHTFYAALTWCATVSLNETALSSSVAQILRFYLGDLGLKLGLWLVLILNTFYISGLKQVNRVVLIEAGSQIQVGSLIEARVWVHCSNTSRGLLLEEIRYQ